MVRSRRGRKLPANIQARLAGAALRAARTAADSGKCSVAEGLFVAGNMRLQAAGARARTKGAMVRARSGAREGDERVPGRRTPTASRTVRSQGRWPVRRLPRGLRVEALFAGQRYVQRVPAARVAPQVPRTVVSNRLASEVADAPGPKRCSRLPWLGRACGFVAKVAIALPGCEAVQVPAVAIPLPRGADLIIGNDFLKRVRCRKEKR
jgi:hypothetical protein